MSEVPVPSPSPSSAKRNSSKRGAANCAAPSRRTCTTIPTISSKTTPSCSSFTAPISRTTTTSARTKTPTAPARGRRTCSWSAPAFPAGKLTADQLLAELDLCDRYGNGTLRITTRQGLQLHGVLKEDLKETIRGINDIKLTTLAACGDVERNVMCCPAPLQRQSVRREMQEMADRVAEHLKPRTTALLRDLAERRRRETKSTRPSSNRSTSRSTAPAICRANSKRPSRSRKTTASRSTRTIWVFWRSSRRARSSATTCSSAAAWE